jgi:hypothetical protein
MFRFRQRTRGTTLEGSRFVNDCASFLSGEYLNDLIATSRDVPAWAWVNAVAHSAPERLVALAHAPHGRFGVEHGEWPAVVRRIATEVIDASVVTEMTVAEIQNAALVPIEFAVMSNPIGPRMTLRAVEHALGRSAR